MNDRRCNHCERLGADLPIGDSWFHGECYQKMPANHVFPGCFRRKDKSAQAQLDKIKIDKNGKLYI